MLRYGSRATESLKKHNGAGFLVGLKQPRCSLQAPKLMFFKHPTIGPLSVRSENPPYLHLRSLPRTFKVSRAARVLKFGI